MISRGQNRYVDGAYEELEEPPHDVEMMSYKCRGIRRDDYKHRGKHTDEFCLQDIHPD